MVGHKVKLQSNDGDTFDVEVDIAKQSVTIKTMLEDLGMEEEEVIPLPNVNSAILKKVIQWATHHKDDPPPPEDEENREKNTNDISTWDLDFLKVDQGTLFELILAANYLDIKGIRPIRKYFELKVEAEDNNYFINRFETTTSEDKKKNVKANFSNAKCLTDMHE
ncbi:unnamed protein product [Adineta steineri]|uniref:SKP1 component POZ domain-containing protein n=1 Tax=Adineta steineri TaxID=433720 RepID=A0A814IXT0_9BILA|nr:unnamed protein product [Adineta steineri]CAF1101496.1 unnamed protein product [Adineta steineri]